MAGFLSLLKSLRPSKAAPSPKPETVRTSTRPISTSPVALKDNPKDHGLPPPLSEILHPSISAEMLSGMHTPTSDSASIHSLTTFRDYRPPGFERLLPRTRRFAPRIRNVHNLAVQTDLKPPKTRLLPVLTKLANPDIDKTAEPSEPKASRKGKFAPRLVERNSSDESSRLCCLAFEKTAATPPSQTRSKLKPKPRARIYAPGESRERKKRNRQPKLRVFLPGSVPPPLPPRPVVPAQILDVGITASPTEYQILDVGITESPTTYSDESAPQLPIMQKLSIWSFEPSPRDRERKNGSEALGTRVITHTSSPPTARPSVYFSRALQPKTVEGSTDPHQVKVQIASPGNVDRSTTPSPDPTADQATNSITTLNPALTLSQIDSALQRLTQECHIVDSFLQTKPQTYQYKHETRSDRKLARVRPESVLARVAEIEMRMGRGRVRGWEDVLVQFAGFGWGRRRRGGADAGAGGREEAGEMVSPRTKG